MKHRIGFNPLGRKPSHRKALHRNMVTSLFKHERIRTTKTKAQAIRRTAEKMITRAKVDSVHNRRMIGRDLKDKAILAKLFVEIGPRFKERPGGYTRILKIGPRPGDGADMVLLELVGEMGEKDAAKPTRGESTKKSAAPKTDKAKSAKGKKKAPKADESVAEVAAEEAQAPDSLEATTEADAESGETADESPVGEPDAQATGADIPPSDPEK